MANLPSCKNLNTEAAASYLLDRFGVERAPDTLLQLRYRGGGPRYLKDATSRRVLYPTDWLDEWVGEQVVMPVPFNLRRNRAGAEIMEENSKLQQDEATGEHAVETGISASAELETKQAQIDVGVHTINVSFLENDTKTEQMSMTVQELFDWIADHNVGVKEARRWSPGIFEPNHRKQDNCQEVGVLVFDVDSNITLEDGIAAVENTGLCAAIVTTFSHQVPNTDGKSCDKYRVILPLMNPFRRSDVLGDYSRAFTAAAKDCARALGFENSDLTVLESARFFYGPNHPSNPPAKPFYQFFLDDGQALLDLHDYAGVQAGDESYQTPADWLETDTGPHAASEVIDPVSGCTIPLKTWLAKYRRGAEFAAMIGHVPHWGVRDKEVKPRGSKHFIDCPNGDQHGSDTLRAPMVSFKILK